MLTKIKSKFIWIIALAVLSLPTFWSMIRTGIYSMQDFPYFRLVEYGKCLEDFQIPCRWSPDAGLGFGEPLFNFYGQVSYFLGGLIHVVGFSYINSLKILFAFTLLGSGITMFLLAKRIWNDKWAGLLSAVIYVYAPYRAVDVWVRGALPEAMSFVIVPLIILHLDTFIETRKRKNLLWFAIFLALLILNHNLSLLIFAPFLMIWALYRLLQSNKPADVGVKIGVAIGISLLLSSFYILPVIFESQYINLSSTVQGYFDFRAHFVTIPQLLISRFWGYGGSTWGKEDGLSLSIGQVQWILPLITIIFGLLQHSFKQLKTVVVLFVIGWFGLFLTHNKSAFLWEMIHPMAYIQFPWRFLMLSLFSFALASGAIVVQLKKHKQLVTILLITVTIILNISFFKEDIWYSYHDSDLTTGERWIEQTRASIGDYWPIYGPIPTSPSRILSTNSLFNHTSKTITFGAVLSKGSDVAVPVNYFPGWTAFIDTKATSLTYNKQGQIMIHMPEGSHKVLLKFVDTPIRLIGNGISILTLFLIGVFLLESKKNYEHKK